MACRKRMPWMERDAVKKVNLAKNMLFSVQSVSKQMDTALTMVAKASKRLDEVNQVRDKQGLSSLNGITGSPFKYFELKLGNSVRAF